MTQIISRVLNPKINKYEEVIEVFSALNKKCFYDKVKRLRSRKIFTSFNSISSWVTGFLGGFCFFFKGTILTIR